MIPDAVSQRIDSVFPGISSDLSDLLRQRIDSFFSARDTHGLVSENGVSVSSEFIRIMLYSEFIATRLTREPAMLTELETSRDLDTSYSDHTFENKLAAMILEDADLPRVKEGLIRFKHYEAVRIAWRDIAGTAGLEETMRDLSNLAKACIDFGVDSLYRSFCGRFGTPTDANGNFQPLIVLGMGKLGAGELNFSSDIDLIFVFPEEGYTNGDNPVSNDEFFTKLCREFIRLFAAGSGIHFYRVDTRLRPFGDSGPLVMSAASFEHYYEAQGRAWERYAMIKAYPVAGDIDAGLELLSSLRPFVYRRYFDYGSFDAFRDMKHRIALQVKSAKLKHNIKLGAGGIREIEFFGQLFQLIRGGVDPVLQERPILKVLDLLKENGQINARTSEDLKKSLSFFTAGGEPAPGVPGPADPRYPGGSCPTGDPVLICWV